MLVNIQFQYMKGADFLFFLFFLWDMHHWNISTVATDNTSALMLSSGHEGSIAMAMISLGSLPFLETTRSVFFSRRGQTDTTGTWTNQHISSNRLCLLTAAAVYHHFNSQSFPSVHRVIFPPHVFPLLLHEPPLLRAVHVQCCWFMTCSVCCALDYSISQKS